MSPTLGMVPDKPAPAMDQPLIEPAVRRSANGVLSTTIRCAYAYRQVGGVQLYVRSYEGGSPGPTLRMKPGEKLKIILVNDLPPNRDIAPADLSNPHQFNTTNFHSHGLHVSPSRISDNVFRSMEPGDGYDVEIAIPRANHPKGTYWYHPHHHGGSDVQIASGGIAGALIVFEGDFADVPEIAAARERVMVLGENRSSMRFGTVENFETLFPETATCDSKPLNGQRAPVIAMRPGRSAALAPPGSRRLPRSYEPLALKDHHHAYRSRATASRSRTMEDPERQMLILHRASASTCWSKPEVPEPTSCARCRTTTGYPVAVRSRCIRLVVAGEPLPMSLPAELPP